MNIIQTELNLGDMTFGNNPSVLVLHHAEASTCTIDDINTWHKERGWAGCGYHYFVRKDGSVYKGRPDNAIGAHCTGHNTNTLGICAEGTYMTEIMSDAQIHALSGLIAYLKVKYNITGVKKHSDLMSTDCPGTNYPFDAIVNGNAAQVVNVVVQAPANNEYDENGTASVCVDKLNVRTAPSTNSNIVASYGDGETFSYNHVVIAEGYVWVRYTGASSGQYRYVAVKNINEGKRYANCY